MSLLRKLKDKLGLGKTLVKAESDEIDLEDIDSFLEQKFKQVRKELDDKKEPFLVDLDELLEKLKANIDVLEKFNVDNVKAEDKLKQITKQGREGYMASLEKFISNLETISNKDKYNFGDINQKLLEFSNSSSKSYHKTTVLIGKEMEKVRDSIISIKKLEDNFLKANSVLMDKLKVLESLKEKNDEVKKKKSLSKGISFELEEIEKNLMNSLDELSGIKSKIEEIEKSPEFKKRQELIIERDKIKVFFDLEKEKLHNLFDKRLLKKYAHLDVGKEKEALAKNYAENPVNALLKDSSFEILNIREDIKKKAEANEINLKNLSKILEKICVSDEVFHERRHKLIEFKQKIEDLDNEIEGIELGLEELKSEKSLIMGKVEINESQKEDFKKKKEKADNLVLEMQEQLKESLKSFNS